MSRDTLSRRDALMFGGAAAMMVIPATAVAASPDELASATAADPVIALFRQWCEARKQTDAINRQMNAIEMPNWVFGHPKVDWAACPELAEIGDRAIPGNPISRHDLREMNRRHAWVNGLIGGKFHQVVTNERKRRVAAGRVRERWWIAEKRRQRAYIVTTGWDRLSDEMDHSVNREGELADQAIGMTATSLAGACCKVLMAAYYTASDNEDRDGLAFNEHLLMGAADDLKLLSGVS